MRPTKMVLVLAGLLTFTLFASPGNEAKAAVNKEMVIEQEQNFQPETDGNFILAQTVSYLTVGFEVAYLPFGPAEVLKENEAFIESPSPVPRSEGIASNVEKGYYKFNRMKQSL